MRKRRRSLKKSRERHARWQFLSAQIVLWIVTIIVLAPIVWMLLSSLKTRNEVFHFSWFPEVPQWHNYIEALRTMNFARYFLNSVFITTVNVVGGTLVASMAGYAFARLEFPGKKIVFAVVIGTMMLPLAAAMIPSFILFRYLNWIDTYMVMTIPVILATPGFFIFLMRQYLMSIPKELDDAAIIDGCGFYRIFWSILVPLAKPAITTIAIYGLAGNWNNLIRPAIFLNSEHMRTVPIGLALLNTQPEEPIVKLELLLANSVLFALVPVLFYMAFQRNFTKLGGGLSGITTK